eukprot:4466042-Amphidinium_carterae.1
MCDSITSERTRQMEATRYTFSLWSEKLSTGKNCRVKLICHHHSIQRTAQPTSSDTHTTRSHRLVYTATLYNNASTRSTRYQGACQQSTDKIGVPPIAGQEEFFTR